MVVFDLALPTLATGAAWFCSSSALSVYANTGFLQAGGSPLGLTIMRTIGGTLFGLVQQLIAAQGDATLVRTLWQKNWRIFLWAAACLFTANASNSAALERAGITLTYVTKSATPVCTALLCLCGLGPRPKLVSSLALLPVVIGVALATFGSAEFSRLGFSYAVLSMMAQSGMNVAAKRALMDSGVSGAKAHWLMCSLISSLVLPMKLIADALAVGSGRASPFSFGSLPSSRASTAARAGSRVAVAPGARDATVQREQFRFNLMAVLAAAAFHIEYTLLFMYSSMVSPVSMAVSDALRRVGMISGGRCIFGGAPLTATNKFGISLAILGTFIYALSK